MRFLDREFYHPQVFIVVQRGCFSSRACRDDPINSVFDLELDQITKSLFIDLPILEGRDNRCVGAGKHKFGGLNNFDGTFEREVSRAFQRDMLEAVFDFFKAHLEPISASHQSMNRGCCVAQRSVDEARRSHAGAARQRLGFYTTLVGSNGYFSGSSSLTKLAFVPSGWNAW